MPSWWPYIQCKWIWWKLLEINSALFFQTSQETADDTCTSEKSTLASKNTDPPDKVNQFTNHTNSDSGDTTQDSEPIINDKEVKENADVDCLQIENSQNHIDSVPCSSSNTEVDKTKDNTQRNVFDAFPIEKLEPAKPSAKNSKLLDKSKHELNETTDCESDSMKLRQFSERNKASKNTDFLSSFESFLKAQQPSQQLSTSKIQSSSTKSIPGVHSLPKTTKETSKPLQESKVRYTDKKEKSQAADSPSLTENVKKKFPKLKELRVSLDSKEVLEHTNSLMLKDNKISNKKLGKDLKMRKVKEVASDTVVTKTYDCKADDVASGTVSKENEKAESRSDVFKENDKSMIASDTLTDTTQNSKVPASVSHHIFDSESAKPLKKRSRRGKRFESFDRINVGENDKIPADSLTGKATDSEDQRVKIIDTVDVNVVENVVKDTSLEPVTDGVQPVSEVKSSESVKLVESSCNDELSVPSCGMDSAKNAIKGKIKKGKSKRSHSKKDKQKKAETGPFTSNMTAKNADVADTNSDKSVKLTIKRSVLHRKCNIVKKYPERTCKLNKLEHDKITEKKTSPKSKVYLIRKLKPVVKKVLQAPAEDENLSQTSDTVKPKKKRRKKVKPWSWGNEKKKYKPKIKILPLVCLSPVPVPLQESEDTTVDIENDMLKQNDEIQADQIDVSNEIVSDTVVKSSLVTAEITDEIDELKTLESSDRNSSNELQTETNLVPLNSDLIDKLPKKSTKRRGSRKHSKGRKSKKLCLTDDNNEDNYLPEIDNKLDSQDKLPDKNEIQDSNLKEDMEYKLINESDISHDFSEPSVNNDKDSDRLCDVPHKSLNTSQTTAFKRTIKKGKRHKKGRKGSVKEQQNLKEQDSAFISNYVSESSGKAKDTLTSELSTLPYQDASNNEKEVLNEAESNNGTQSLDQHQQLDNEPRLDTAHVSPDSGIESVAGSPVGNESPNSVLSSEAPHSIAYHPTSVQFTLNTSTSDSNKCVFTDSIFATISSSVLLTCSSSATTSTDSLVRNLDLSNDSGKSVITKTSSVISSVCVQSVCESKTFTDDKDVNGAPGLLSSKHSNMKEKSREQNLGSISPSKKKNRAKFLQHYKTSVLLKQGRMPTESEKEQMLEDKFSYLNKVRENESKEDVSAKLVYINDTVLFKSDSAKAGCSSETPEKHSDNESKSDKLYQSGGNLDEPISDIQVIKHDEQSLSHVAENTDNDTLDAIIPEQETSHDTVNVTGFHDTSTVTIDGASTTDTEELSDTVLDVLNTVSTEQLPDNVPEQFCENQLEHLKSTQLSNIDSETENLVGASDNSQVNTEYSTESLEKQNSETGSEHLGSLQNIISEKIADDTEPSQNIIETTEHLDSSQNSDH